MAGQRADGEVVAGRRGRTRGRDPADVDEHGRCREPQLHQRDQRHAAGEELGVLAVLADERDGLVGRVGADVVERRGDHCAPPVTARRRPRARPSRCCGSRCSGRGCPRARGARRARSGSGSPRGTRPRPSPCPPCRTRTAGRGARGTPAAPGAACPRSRGPRSSSPSAPSACAANIVHDFTDSPSSEHRARAARRRVAADLRAGERRTPPAGTARAACAARRRGPAPRRSPSCRSACAPPRRRRRRSLATDGAARPDTGRLSRSRRARARDRDPDQAPRSRCIAARYSSQSGCSPEQLR